jgi:hypothetical protein
VVYLLLLGFRRWIDSMCVSCVLHFSMCYISHTKEKSVIVDQLAFFNSDSCTSNVPFISKTPPGYENVGVGLLKDSTLMGTFPIPPPDVPPPFVASINMISTSVHETPVSHDPWIVPDLGDYLLYGEQMPLSRLNPLIKPFNQQPLLLPLLVIHLLIHFTSYFLWMR